MRFWYRETIKGCDARGDKESPYLTRLFIFRSRVFTCVLNTFHRSDADDLHDHPWPFVSIILKGGYFEETPRTNHERNLRWHQPGSILFRSARHRHRVALKMDLNSKYVECKTLVFMGPVCRRWGFWTKTGWKHWKEYFEENGC